MVDLSEGLKKVSEKSFWERPEGKTGLIAVLAALGFGGFILYRALPFIIKLLENTLYASAMAAVLVLVTSPLWSTKMRTLTSYLFRSAMRAITGMIVELDPIGIIKSYVEDLRKSQSNMQQQIANLKGVMVRLSDTIAEQKKDLDHSMRVAKAAKDQKNAKALRLQSRSAGRLNESNLTLQALYDRLDRLHKYLTKLMDVTETMILDMEDEVKVETQKRKAIRAAHGAFSSAMKVLRGSGDGKEMYDLAMESMANDYAMKMGEIEDFMAVSEGFIASVDLDNLAFEQEALEKLEQMEAGADRLLEPRSKAHALSLVHEEDEVASLFRA